VPAAKILDTGAGRPFLKWAGGKGQLLDQFRRFYPARKQVKRYLEPFLGGGAVFFHVRALVRPATAILSDGNEELIATFKAVREEPEAVLAHLEDHRARHSKEHFYEVRAQAEPGTPSARAARMIYLNRSCFNGLYRVNSRGLFNVPFGKYENPRIVDRPGLLAASASLRKARLSTAPFTKVLDVAKAGDFIYFDPPYVPLSRTANFTAYTQSSFGPREQETLAEVYTELHGRGCLVMLSNSDTPWVRERYARFHVHEVMARRNINSKSDSRGEISEVVVLNYRPGEVT
jgi:DNA adenine methylase